MSDVVARTLLRRADGSFVPIEDATSVDGDCDHLPGAVELHVSGAEVLTRDLWDDVNWLWPLIVQAVEECRTTGTGQRSFPDQPVRFEIRALPQPGWVLVRVHWAQGAHGARVRLDELLRALAAAGLHFVQHYERLCGGGHHPAREVSIMERWLELTAGPR